MKQLLVILLTFTTTFATSFLLDLHFINCNIVRYVIVIAFIIVQFIIGFQILKTISKQ